MLPIKTEPPAYALSGKHYFAEPLTEQRNRPHITNLPLARASVYQFEEVPALAGITRHLSA
ncbi:hypothetical protein QWZ08_06810 [Ferruginibacter paludis]|uniref:hypothetical protein n=1 Tax=Ferruginibacter paludis TaxID=1310417 RepID=UPI0025B4C65A|nr:hypothetical protein [Ferruginibacter paludis]MDN3655326.1 hypothetical protein [Ferruginibacter paludis]